MGSGFKESSRTQVACAAAIAYTFSMVLIGSVGYSVEKPKSPDRLSVDWGSMRISFYGEASPAAPGQGFKDIETRARSEAIAAAKTALLELYKAQMGALGIEPTQGQIDQAVRAVVEAPKSVRTEYFSDGTVRVYYENSLAKALAMPNRSPSTQQKVSMEGSLFSGLILRSEAALAPRPGYEVVDETGRVLFSGSDVAEEAYQENLMGRWFKNPSRRDLSDAVGPKPVSINFQVDEKGRLVVQGNAWQEAISNCPGILKNARIAIITR